MTVFIYLFILYSSSVIKTKWLYKAGYITLITQPPPVGVSQRSTSTQTALFIGKLLLLGRTFSRNKKGK